MGWGLNSIPKPLAYRLFFGSFSALALIFLVLNSTSFWGKILAWSVLLMFSMGVVIETLKIVRRKLTQQSLQVACGLHLAAFLLAGVMGGMPAYLAVLLFLSALLTMNLFALFPSSEYYQSIFFILSYASIPFLSAYTMLALGRPEMVYWVLYIVTVAKTCDLMGFWVGTRFGKTPFMPRISPKKTLEGAAAGMAGSLVVSLIWWIFSPLPLTWISAPLFGLFCGAGAILGDLVESKMKREALIKDSGIVPGLGGLLDMSDSLLLLFPAMQVIIEYFYYTVR